MASWFTRTVVLVLLASVIAALISFGTDLRRKGWSASVAELGQLGSWIGVGLFSVVVGSLLGMFMEFEKEKYEEALRGVDVADFTKVSRALARGPVPEDPAIRRAAMGIAQIYLDREPKSRVGSMFVYPLMIGSQVYILRSATQDWSGPWSAYATLLISAALGAVVTRAWFRRPLLRARVELFTMHESQVLA